MKKILNRRTILLATGVLQPTNPAEILGFLRVMLPHAGELPNPTDILMFLKAEEATHRVIRVARNVRSSDLYGLTLKGHRYLTRRQRKTRDKFRFYLLRDAHRGRFTESGGELKRLVGVAPTVDTSAPEKGAVANKIGQGVPTGRSYWPRISRQFETQTGSTSSSPDTFPDWLSYRNQRQCEVAVDAQAGEFQFDYEGMAACLGVSPAILSQIAHAPARHYRSFQLRKLGGGERTIETPRVFLKVVQWFLADFVLLYLPVHASVHSFRRGHSIVSNAKLHVAQKFVGNIDIADFFGSIQMDAVRTLLQANGFRTAEAKLIARLCCKDGHLPQGAPTSPMLSNAILHGFDAKMANLAVVHNLRYSRYADDITFSGDHRSRIEDVLLQSERSLRKEYGLTLNVQKSRIASSHSQQRVTGVVVNQFALPPRELRRQVRAMFHNANQSVHVSEKMMGRLRGYLAFLKMFPDIVDSAYFRRLEIQMANLTARQGAGPRPIK